MKQNISLFNGLPDLPPSVPAVHVRQSDVNSDEMFRTVFAPDPVTGLPMSDVRLLVNKDTNPQVQQFIRNHLMDKKFESPRAGTPEQASSAIRRYGETITAYADRLRKEWIESNKKNVQPKEKEV